MLLVGASEDHAQIVGELLVGDDKTRLLDPDSLRLESVGLDDVGLIAHLREGGLVVVQHHRTLDRTGAVSADADVQTLDLVGQDVACCRIYYETRIILARADVVVIGLDPEDLAGALYVDVARAVKRGEKEPVAFLKLVVRDVGAVLEDVIEERRLLRTGSDDLQVVELAVHVRLVVELE